MNKFEKNRKKANKAFPQGKENSVKAEGSELLPFTFFLVAGLPEDEIPDISHYEKLPLIIGMPVFNLLEQEDMEAPPYAVQAVEDFANKYGLSIINKKNIDRWISLEGKVDDVEKALNISLRKFYLGETPYYFYRGEIAIPEELKDAVEGITGINNEPVKTKRVFPDEKILEEAKLKGLAVLPQDFAKLYNFPKNLDGSGQCIAIISLGGGYDNQCLQSYFETIGIPMPDISWVSVDGAQNNPNENIMYDYEVYMDIEIAAALAPGAKIVVYFANNTAAGVIKAIKAAVNDAENNPGIISMSWGCLENAFSTVEKLTLNHVLKEAAAKNVSVLTSSGDLGSSGQPVDEGLNIQIPASNPYVLAVGGSQVNKDGDVILDEKVWAQTVEMQGQEVGVSSGGGFSSFWGIPQYQLDAIQLARYKQLKRGIPDVAANASTKPGILIQVHNSEQISMGTSAATPLWAALMARINQYLQSLGLPRAGFVNPFFYHNEFSPAFNQITTGNNGAYDAAPGWDPCTGMGTPNGDVLMQKIALMKKQSLTKA